MSLTPSVLTHLDVGWAGPGPWTWGGVEELHQGQPGVLKEQSDDCQALQIPVSSA